MKDDLGDRMKGNYEDRTRYSLPRRTYTIIRLDGKAFHTYTRGLQKPFDKGLTDDMDYSIITMMPEIQGAVFAYTQSDEISVLVTDFAQPTTSAWFDGNLQKICSVAASIITAKFNFFRMGRILTAGSNMPQKKTAYFDARVFTIPDPTEVMNYFIWRNQDCSRNSVSMVAQANFSHSELQGKSTKEMLAMLSVKGESSKWESYPEGDKFGRIIFKEEYDYVPSETDGSVLLSRGEGGKMQVGVVKRTRWASKPAWKFTEDKEKLAAMIPKYE